MKPVIVRAFTVGALAAGLATGLQPSAASPAAKAKQKTESAGQLMGNAGLTAKVKSALLADKVAPGLEINVNSSHGVVTLLGQVETAAQKSRAGQVAKKTAGVKKVVNKLTVKPAAKKDHQ